MKNFKTYESFLNEIDMTQSKEMFLRELSSLPKVDWKVDYSRSLNTNPDFPSLTLNAISGDSTMFLSVDKGTGWSVVFGEIHKGDHNVWTSTANLGGEEAWELVEKIVGKENTVVVTSYDDNPETQYWRDYFREHRGDLLGKEIGVT